MNALRVSIDEAADCYLVGNLPTGEVVTVTSFYNMDGSSAVALTSNTATELPSTGLFYWSLSGITTSPTVAMSIIWVMTSGSTARTDWGVIYIGGHPDVLETAVETIDTVVDSILVDTGSTLPSRFDDLDTSISTVDGIVDSILVDTAVIGTAVALDGASATLGGMLTKMADDNGGLDFDATTDSLQAISDGEATAPTVAQIRAEMDSNSTQLAAIVLDTGTTLPATLATIDGIVDSILVDTATTIPAKIDVTDGKVDNVQVDTTDLVNKLESGSLAPDSVQFE